jgi:hypothetical protein
MELIREWSRSRPEVPVVALEGTDEYFAAPMFHVHAGIRLSAADAGEIESLRVDGPVALVAGSRRESRRGLPAEILAMRPEPLVRGAHYNLHLIPRTPPAGRGSTP